MTTPSFVDLVYAGRVDEAIAAVSELTPHTIYTRLFVDDDRHLQDQDAGDVFVRAWYETLTSPYLRAEAAYEFADVFLTELAPAPNGEFIGANLKTEALRNLLTAISVACLGDEVNEWEETPEQPLPAASAAKWREIGRVIASLDFPPPVPRVAPLEN
ncbi:hypothetical protein [Microbacterium sp. NPDC055665]